MLFPNLALRTLIEALFSTNQRRAASLKTPTLRHSVHFLPSEGECRSLAHCVRVSLTACFARGLASRALPVVTMSGRSLLMIAGEN